MVRRLLILMFAIVLVAMVIPQAAPSTQAQSDSAVFVLVHGAFQDGAGWVPVIAELEAAGHTAIAVNLPARGEDTTPSFEASLERYRDTVIAVIEQQDQPVVLVGHSFGGMVISVVAEAIPDQIQTAVYVSAYLPLNGDSLLTIASEDNYSLLGQEGNFVVDDATLLATVIDDVFATGFCPDCDADQLLTVAASQISEPVIPLTEPVVVTEENFGAVEKAYIITAADVIVSAQLQAYMLSNTPVEYVYALNTGHVPYVTAPVQLAEILIEIASK